MRTSVVVVIDPATDGGDGLIGRREAMLPYAFAFERFVVGFHNTVLLRCVRMDELLAEAVGPEKPPVESRSENEAIVAAHDDAGITLRQDAKAFDTRVFKRPHRLLRPAVLADAGCPAAPLREQSLEHSTHGKSAASRGHLRAMRRAGGQAQAPALRRVHSQGARSGVVPTRDCAEARCLQSREDRARDAVVARGLLADSRRNARPASQALGAT